MPDAGFRLKKESQKIKYWHQDPMINRGRKYDEKNQEREVLIICTGKLLPPPVINNQHKFTFKVEFCCSLVESAE